MKYTLILLFVLDVLLAGAAAIRMAGAPFEDSKPAAVHPPASGTGLEREMPASATPAPGQNLVTGMATPAAGADVPPGLEGAVGANRPTYDPDLADPNAALDKRDAAVREAEEKVKLGRKIANGGKLP